jgi:ABC-type branched-subunit amino acid transport system ATPase component
VRAYSKGNRQKLILIAGLMTRSDLLTLDEPDQRAGPPHGADLPPVRPGSQGT